MADVKKYTDQIAKAQKGRDVRDSIVNAINAVSDENNEYNQVKSDILAAQSDIAEKVAKNEQTEQTFAADVKKAEELKQGLDTDITQGTALKSQLDDTVKTADTSKKNLDASNTEAGKTKTALDVSNTTASEAKTGLDATNKTAADLVASLRDKITEGTQVKTDIQTTGETAMSNLQAEATKQQEYIKTSIDDTLSISGKAADAAVTGKKIDSLKEDLSSKITKFYASSQGETHITDSDNGKIMDMMLYGKSEQKQYSGKNLFDFHQLKPKTPNTTTVTTTEDAIIVSSNAQTFTGAFKIYEECDAFKGKTITISANIVKADNFDTIINFGCGLFYENAWHWKLQKVTDLGARYITVIVPETITKIQFLLNTNDNNVAKANTITVSEYMVEYGSEPTSYEPYTGGIPSPNPDYPQEIKSVVNPIVKVCGKNLLKATLRTTTQNGVTCTANGDGTYTLNGTASANAVFNLGSVTFTGDTKYKICGCPQGGGTGERYHIEPHGSTNEQRDIGNGVIYSLPNDETKVIYIVVTIGFRVNNLLFKPMITTDLAATYDDFEPYHEQTVTIPYTLNATPVNSGGNVAIDGQQYIADYVDVERGKLVRKIKEISKDPIVLVQPTNNPSKKRFILGNKFLKAADNFNKWSCKCSNLQTLGVGMSASYGCVESCGIDAGGNLHVYYEETSGFTTAEEFKAWWGKRDIQLMGILETPIEIDLTPEEIAASKALATYYPVTNISINSEQLDGYTVFNYPISMANGWNYVKKQLNDNRDYIYDMDTQSAEAYVNSEYAVALTELEV